MTAVAPIPSSGWQARLALGFEQRPLGTVLKHVRHEGPLRVQRPFYPETGLPHVYLLHPPGGVTASDSLDIRVNLSQGSQALLTSPGSTKYYRSAGETASVRQHLAVERGGSLEWLPQENIIFPGARVHSVTRVSLSGDARFMGWDMTCFGRPCNGETFDHGRFYGRLEVFRDQRPLLYECQRLQDSSELTAAAGLRGFPMQAVFLATHCDTHHLTRVRALLNASACEHPAAATLIDGLLIVRTLGYQAEALRQQLTPLWQTLRPLLLNRAAVVPRIWAT